MTTFGRKCCNWCGGVLDQTRKPYCVMCQSLCVKECHHCHRPFRSLVSFSRNCSVCNACHKKTMKRLKAKKETFSDRDSVTTTTATVMQQESDDTQILDQEEDRECVGGALKLKRQRGGLFHDCRKTVRSGVTEAEMEDEDDEEEDVVDVDHDEEEEGSGVGRRRRGKTEFTSDKLLKGNKTARNDGSVAGKVAKTPKKKGGRKKKVTVAGNMKRENMLRVLNDLVTESSSWSGGDCPCNGLLAVVLPF